VRARRVADGIDFGKLPLPVSPHASVVKAALRGLGRTQLVIPRGPEQAIDFTGKYLPPAAPDAQVRVDASRAPQNGAMPADQPRQRPGASQGFVLSLMEMDYLFQNMLS